MQPSGRTFESGKVERLATQGVAVSKINLTSNLTAKELLDSIAQKAKKRTGDGHQFS